MATRKNTLIALVAGIIIILGGYAISKYTSRPVSYEAPSDSLVAVTGINSNTSTTNADSDGDGLPDWQEALWKTDPYNPDSDGDGVLDGEEVRTSHDPTKKGPNDAIVTSAGTSTSSTALTPTEKLSQDILKTYLQLKAQANGKPVTPASIQELLNRNQPKIIAIQYTHAQFKEGSDNQADIEAYGKTLTAILSNYVLTGQKNEMQILQQAQEQTDSALVKQLETRSDNYKKAVQALLVLLVPPSVLALHADLTNTISLMSEIVHAMSLLYTDPITSLTGIQQYTETQLIFANQLKVLGSYFTEHSNSQ